MGRSDRDRRSRRSRSRSPRSSRRRSRSASPKRRDRSRSPRDRRNRDRGGDNRDKRRDDRRKVEEIIGGEVNLETFDKDEQQRKLEILMQERRERVEKWRLKHKTLNATNSTEVNNTEVSGVDENADSEVKKTWTLEDENDDEEEDNQVVESMDDLDDEQTIKPMPKKEEDNDEELAQLAKIKAEKKPKVEVIPPKPEPEAVVDDDIDPLDAYMMGIQEEVKKMRSKTVKSNEKDNKVTVVVGIAKKAVNAKNKGELIEQNMDAMEYSSEDEGVQDDDLANAMDNLQNKVKQKKLMTITKDDITYQSFRKNFYIEVPELAKMTNEEVEAFRSDMEGIKAKGKGCPKPIKTWVQCGVSKKVLDVLKRNNYEKPTPIQCQAIPAIMSGRDLIGIAKTGSGKTLAFLLPMFRHIMDQQQLESGDGPIAIIMTPTRELATQIWSECKKFAKPLNLRVVAVYGGTPISEQIGELKPGAEIVVCTPGRMIDMLAANSGRVTNLRRCTYCVLDEADRMFDMGFEPQVMRIIDGVRPDRQTVMFSATFPRIMEALARRILDKPIEVQVGGRSVVCKEVVQNVVVIDEDEKFLKLLEILGRFATVGSAIVFVDKQENADMLLKELMHASYTCLALHGGIDQNDRDSTIADFKNGKVNVLVATSVAARGLDVKHCVVVINYDCPNHYEDYVHRCGRTGRAGNEGHAYTFITPEQGKYANDLIKAFELSGLSVPDELRQLSDGYKLMQEALGKKVKSASGFSGKGFKFDEAEAQLANEKKKYQKAALGLQDSDDEDPEADIDQEIENMLAPKKSTKQVPIASAPVANSVAGVTVTSDKSVTEKLELAKRLASKISVNMAGKSTLSTTEAFLKGESFDLGVPNVISAKSRAEQIAERLHAKLNYVPKDVEYNEDGEIVRKALDDDDPNAPGNAGGQRFEEELEINEFPQQARWKVTSKEALAQISEYSEAGITVRGTYFPPGKEPGLADRKLYLAIEGASELSVSKARAEIIRLIKEELVKMQNTYTPVNRGRYKVV
ncbi:probable ATP-dependent RNA helicase DDX46 [Oppia nitens]|uniref:probable ATP-dependent RNA helicase DDX46 n=1 Tax=Oppia nitens TaxID=1686743 RepID=UPI0023DAD8EF|nr:probable ATP-dependent RNA helicase DDX46 [Oppia nitens]